MMCFSLTAVLCFLFSCLLVLSAVATLVRGYVADSNRAMELLQKGQFIAGIELLSIGIEN